LAQTADQRRVSKNIPISTTEAQLSGFYKLLFIKSLPAVLAANGVYAHNNTIFWEAAGRQLVTADLRYSHHIGLVCAYTGLGGVGKGECMFPCPVPSLTN
jgi:hypothetical protein